MTTRQLYATLFKARLFAAVSCGLTTLHAADIAELTITGDTELSTPLAYSGEGFVATTPNSSAAHRNAVAVVNDAVLTLASGAQLLVANDDNNTTFLRVGYYNADNPSAGTGHLVIESGATLQVGQSSRYANFMVGEGEGNTGDVDQNGGYVTVLGSFNLGIDGGQGTYVIDGGTLTIDHADDAGHTTLATLGLNLNLAGPDAGTSSGELVINGGTVNVLAHEYDPVGNPGVHGATALILGNRDRGAASYGEGNGTLTQNGGVLHIDNHAQLYLSSVGNGEYNLNGGTLEIGGSSLRAKYGNGPGTYAFNLGGGTLNVGQYPASGDSNAFILGRSRTGQQVNTSVGRLNVGGTGHLVLNTNTPLLIGGDYGSTAALSEGRVDQTGGTVTVNSKIDIGSSGHGEYNLSGGVLEIGGANTLVSTSGDYALNLGGGTLTVIGSDLVTALRANLVDATTSTVDTNGLGAAFTSGLTGDGGLQKTGAGTLRLDGVSDHAGDTDILAGTLDVDGIISASHVRVSAGATLTGDGTLADATLAFADPADALTFTGDLTLAATTQTVLGVLGESEFNRLVVDGTLFADGVLEITFLDGFVAAEGASFDFIDGTIAGTFAAFVLPTLDAGLEWNLAGLYTDGVLSVTASSVVPEPATFGALLGTLTLAFAASRRRRS